MCKFDKLLFDKLVYKNPEFWTESRDHRRTIKSTETSWSRLVVTYIFTVHFICGIVFNLSMHSRDITILIVLLGFIIVQNSGLFAFYLSTIMALF